MTKNELTESLKAFAFESPFDASKKFLELLGVRCATLTEEPFPLLDLYAEAARDVGAKVPEAIRDVLGRVDAAYFVGTVDDRTLVEKVAAKDGDAVAALKAAAAKEKYDGLFAFAVQMKPGVPLSRADASTLVRAINRLARQNPATVLILEGTTPEGMSLSIATCERTAYKQAWRPGERLGKVSILKDINCCAPHRGHVDILESMNVKKAKSFDALYEQWKKVFSTSLLTNKFYNELFGWYVWAVDSATDVYFPNDPDDDKDDYEGRDTKIIRLITRVMFVWFIRQKKLVPDWIFDEDYLGRILKDFNPVATDSGNYYNAVLQNLFFATLNRAIEDEDGKRRFAELSGHVDAKNLYRYDELYTISKDEIVEHFASIPFVNGSLFECLDKTKGNDGVGKAFYYDGFSRNNRRVPGTNHYRYRAFVPNNLFFDPERGLFSIFSRYNFTIEENTPLEQQVALDPELLGKVFENLLGVYNPETKETARKQSGSFYTPREIVDYMVDETLISYLGSTKLVRNLFSESFTYNDLDWSEYQAIAAKLKTVKILDPACGSGAFPVGMLNRIIDIFDLMRIKENRYTLKRYIIEHCLYGVDKQCVATLITRLRFFISLIIDCTYDSSKENFGIPILPNLENNFVTADTLIRVKRSSSSICNAEIAHTKEELHKVRHDHFNAKSASSKRRLVDRDKFLRKQLAELLVGKLYSAEEVQRLLSWNPYCQNVSADFFDAEWMLGIADGFDVVIGNPPHGAKITPAVKVEPYALKCGETAILFIERGLSLVNAGGLLLYVLPKPFCYASNYKKTRNYVFGGLQQIVDCGKIFDKVKFEECVVILQPSKKVEVYESLVFNKSLGFIDFGLIEKKVKDEFGIFLNGTSMDEISLGRRLRLNCKHLRDYVTNTRGGQVQKFVKDIADFPVIGGKGISRYGIVSEKGAVSKNDIQADDWYCKDDSILVQNLVAHIANPVPHIKITACFSPGRKYIIADTVNQISIIDPQMPKQLLWAILNSRLINWYSYKFIFGNAIRTMHFDAVSTDKIPIPDLTDRRITEIVRQAEVTLAAHVQHQLTTVCDRGLDEAICRLYGLNDEETAAIMALPT